MTQLEILQLIAREEGRTTIVLMESYPRDVVDCKKFDAR